MYQQNGKVCSLKEAISSYIKPWSSIHLASGLGGPSAAVCEIIRQYHGKKPGFELIQSTVTGHSLNLLYCGLLNRMIFSVCMDNPESGQPGALMQKKCAKGSIEFENWSLCTLQQRLLAGAMGLEFITTRSLSGSSLAGYNQAAFAEIDSPFNKDRKAGVIKALNPDVSIIHAVAADEQGNAIPGIPYGDDIWGIFASRTVLVTTERIVPSDYIRRYSALVKIPSYLVKAVSPAPYGIHPFSLGSPGLTDFAGYETDLAFLQKMQAAFQEETRLNQWLQEWVLDCTDQQAYLAKLGQQRLARLNYQPAFLKKSFSLSLSEKSNRSYTDEEMLAITAAREIRQKTVRAGHKTILLITGMCSAAVLMAYYTLKEAGYELEIVTGNGQYGYDPGTGGISAQSLAGIYNSKMSTDTIVAQAIIISGENNRCLGILEAGQIDRWGNINSTPAFNNRFLVGSGGANDAGNASEVIVVINQSRKTFVGELPYITCPGKNITTVITNLGIYRKPRGKRELILTACLPDPKLNNLIDRINRARMECDWQLRLGEKIKSVPEPVQEELSMLRQITEQPVVK